MPRASIYSESAARWSGFARSTGIDLIRDGADWVGAVEPLVTRLEHLGFAFERRTTGVHLPGEARVEPRHALAALTDRIGRGGGAFLDSTAEAIEVRDRRLFVRAAISGLPFDGFRADAVVLASGWRARSFFPDAPPALAAITPVKGQIIELIGVAAVERTTRSERAYLVPRSGGVVVGSTMEAGVTDLTIDQQVVDRLAAAAAIAAPALRDARLGRTWAGVRGATPDGLPLAGALGETGVYAALAPRRNGWLLAPLVAETVVAAMAGEPLPHLGEAFRPDRFDPA